MPISQHKLPNCIIEEKLQVKADSTSDKIRDAGTETGIEGQGSTNTNEVWVDNIAYVLHPTAHF